MNTEDKTQRILERLTIKALEEASDLILSLQIQVAQLERGVVPAADPDRLHPIRASTSKTGFLFRPCMCNPFSATIT